MTGRKESSKKLNQRKQQSLIWGLNFFPQISIYKIFSLHAEKWNKIHSVLSGHLEGIESLILLPKYVRVKCKAMCPPGGAWPIEAQ